MKLFKSIDNSRELGGYTSSDGRKIRSGVLLRTAKLDAISDEDIRILRDKYRLQDIIDLRMEVERIGADDPEIDGARYSHLDVLDFSDMMPEDAEQADINGFSLPEIVELMTQTGMLTDKMYIGFLMNKKGYDAFSGFFRILLEADPDRAVLWHCTSGKDRTGLAAMLLLTALEVDEETIVSDFILTNEYNASRIEATRKYLTAQGCDNELIQKGLLVFDMVDESFLRTAMNYLKKEFGSVKGYITDALNITEDEINSLKEKYLV